MQGRPVLPRLRKILPALLVACLVVILLGWNAAIGITWQGPSLAHIALTTSPLLALALYARWRGDRVISEIATYLFLYFIFPVTGVKLSYLAATLHYALIDDFLAGFDTALGFSWAGWAAFNDQHPLLKSIVSLAYASPIAQAVASVVIFAIWRNGRRNAETLCALVLAMAIVLVVCAYCPAIGPQARLGIATPYAQIVASLRAGKFSALPYQGIVWFPSYHTVMALVFTYGHRGLKYSFPPVLALNAAMLLAIPNIGCHYLADMAAGAAVACVSIVVTTWVYTAAPAAAFVRSLPSPLKPSAA